MKNHIDEKRPVCNLTLWRPTYFLVLCFIFILTACGGGGSGSSSGAMNPTATTGPTLQSITVTPNALSAAAGTTKQYTATGNYSDGTSKVIPSPSWSSSASTVATVSNTGLVTAILAGNATVIASTNGIQGSTPLTVTAAILTSITVSSSSLNLPVGLTAQFTATGQYSDGTSQVILTSTWTSSSPANTSISPSGLATGLQPGSSTITASSSGVSSASNPVTGSTTLTITPAALQSITVTAPRTSIPMSFNEQLVATGVYSDGSTQPLTAAVWNSSVNTIATVSPTGLLTSTQSGATTISATVNGITGNLAVTVTTATPSSVAIVENYGTSNYVPQASIPTTLYLGTVVQLTPLVLYTDGSAMVLTLLTSSSSGNTIVTITPAGVLTPVAPGTAKVSIAYATFTASITFTVSSATLTSVAVSPASISVAPASTQTLTATATYSDGNSQVIQEQTVQPITWTTSANNVVTVLDGVVNWVGAGNAVITATFGGKSGTAAVTATP